MKTTIVINGETMHLITGMSIEEWEGNTNKDLWDMPFEEFLDGTLAVNEDIWYLYINGRIYETSEEV